MKWSEETVKQLRDLAFAGKSNAEIARAIGVGINEVYAKRSQLGITIDKVKAVQSQMAISPEVEKMVQDMDDRAAFVAKQGFIKRLEPVLKEACPSVKYLSLMDNGNTVLIAFWQHATKVNIEGDSLLAILFDVMRKCL
jgi:hypothetical protein